MSDHYTPTPSEYLGARQPSDELKLSGDGIFATLQGEGVTAGRPSVFLRLQNCNLHCGEAGVGWRCDAWYTWDESTPEYWQETRLAAAKTVAEEVEAAWRLEFPDTDLAPNLVITGGEPLLQQRKLTRLLPLLENWDFEIETNGTVLPADELRIAQINCSPKLASSGNQLPLRRRARALERIANFPNHWFKFVIAAPNDLIEVSEVMQLCSGGDFSRVILMSQGVDREKLIESDLFLRAEADRRGCHFTARNQIFWYGDTRAT